LKFEIAINRLWPGEKLPQGDPRWKRYTRSFHRERHTLDSLIAHIRKGHAFSPVMACGHRNRENFVSAQHIGLDDDRGTPGSSVDSLARDPFIACRAAFLYETISSTPEHPKSRIVFILDQAITDPARYRLAQRGLTWKFADTDQSVAEESRFFYGSPNARVVQLGNVLGINTLQAQVIGPFLSHLQDQANILERDINFLVGPPAVAASAPDRYVHRVVHEEVAWLSTRKEGTGERHRGLLVSAIRLASLRLSQWLPPGVRDAIDPYPILLPAARANGYIAKYGEEAARRTIADGISYAIPRPAPPHWGNNEVRRNPHRPRRITTWEVRG
jgi:hypothetical protein